MKEIDYPSLDAHLIIGVEAATLLNVFIGLHNSATKKIGKEFDGIIKGSYETLALLSGMKPTKTKELVKQLTGKLNGFKLIQAINKPNGCKANLYKVNTTEIEKLNFKAESCKLKWIRGYGNNKYTESLTASDIYERLSNELLHRHIEKKKRGV